MLTKSTAAPASSQATSAAPIELALIMETEM